MEDKIIKTKLRRIKSTSNKYQRRNGGDYMQINVSYITANEIMEILGVGRSKAYEIMRVMNEELEQAGYNIIKGKVPVRYFQKKYYGCEMSIE